MKLFKKIVVLICLSSMLMGCNLSSQENLVKKNQNQINSKKIVQLKYMINTNDGIPDVEIEKDKLRILSVDYNREDVTALSHITKDEMKEVLENTKGSNTMVHLSDTFVEAEDKYGVNAFFLAGIVALESGFATSRRAIEDNNLTGYEVYTDKSKGKLFSSQRESILQTAKNLSENYLKHESTYYKGLSVDAIQINYCPDEDFDKNWEGQVDYLSNSFLNTYNKIFKNSCVDSQI